MPVRATACDMAAITLKRETFSLVSENVKYRNAVTTLQIITMGLL